MKKFLIFLLLFPVLALADAVIFSGTDVKALKQNLDLFGVVKVMSGNVDPSAGAGVAAPVGSAYLSKTNGLYLKTGVLNTDWTRNSLLPVDLTADVTGVLPIANGGTNVSTIPTNGQLLIGNGTGYTQATITGNLNQVSVTNGAGSISLSTPQNIDTSADTQFKSVTVSDTNTDIMNLGSSIVELQSTGIASGGTLSVNIDPSKFDMSAVVGQIINSTTNGSPSRNAFTCPPVTGGVVTNLASQDVTYILIDATCTITQQATFPTADQRRSKVFIGRLNHYDRTSILFANTIASYLQSPMSQLFDLMDSMGPFNVGDGNLISANGANLSMNKTTGQLFVPSYNYATNNQSPNNVDTVARTAFTFRYATKTTLTGSSVSVLDPTSYDVGGTITNVPGAGGQATVARVYLFPSNNITVQYGQAAYSSLSVALQQFQTETFIENPTIRGVGVLIAYVAMQENCTSLLDANRCKIIPVLKNGSISGGVGGTTNLQQAYANSSQPQITTDATRGAVEIKRGSAADTDDVVRVLNGSGTKTSSITGSGVITGANLSGTNTGDTEIGNDAGNIGVAKEFDFPNSQIVQTDSTNKKFRIESGNNNELYNGGFEAETLAVGWTISNATSSSSTTRIEGSKSLSLALTGALSLSQSSTINAAQKSGVQMVASIWVNSSDVSDLQLCSLKNGSEDKCTVTGGYVQGSGWRQLTVSFLGNSTSNGLKLKSTDTTGTVLVDQAYVGIGSPIVDFTPDMVYSAQVTTTTGAVSGENIDFIASCTAANPTVCTFNSGIFTTVPNCTLGSSSWAHNIKNVTTTGFILDSFNTTTGAPVASLYAFVTCVKTGADYKTSKAYVASSSDFGYTNAGTITITATTTNPTKGTVVTDRIMASRKGQNLIAEYQYEQSSAGTAGTGDYLFTLPSGLSFDTSIVIPYTGSNYTQIMKAAVGYASLGVTSNSTGGKGILVAYDSTRFRLVADNIASAAGTVASRALSSSWFDLSFASIAFNLKLNAPIQGWTDSGVIVGSFQGYNYTPNVDRVETFSVSYGTTNATTVCSASPCSYLDQIGNAVYQITRSGTGTYTMVTNKTYVKLKCVLNGMNITNVTIQRSNPMSCSSCSSLTFNTGNPGSADYDTFGTLYCQGIPQ